MVETGLAKSRGDARRTIADGGAYLNNQRVEDAELVPSVSDLVGGSWLVLRRGKKTFAGVEVTPISNSGGDPDYGFLCRQGAAGDKTIGRVSGPG